MLFIVWVGVSQSLGGACPSSVDVRVVRSGPAGSAAAVALSRAERDVSSVDAASFSHLKDYGEGLMPVLLRSSRL